MNRIVLAYSGGLDTSVAIPWLAERHHAEIVTVTMDVGQGKALKEVRDRALAAGAARAHVLDVREEFARHHVLRALKADAVDEGGHPMIAALDRPLIAQKLVEIAALEQATAVAHGSARTDPGVLDRATRALNPAIAVLAPARDWEMTRPEAIEYARVRGVPLPATDSPHRTDANLWGRSIRCGVLDDARIEPAEDLYTLTKRAAECPDEAAYVEMAFERGVPTAINGVAMPLVELIASLGTIAGAHGVGRFETAGDRPADIPSRAIGEAPAAVVLHAAHNDLQRLVTTKEADHFSRVVSRHYADVVSNGLWFTPLRAALDAYVDTTQARVTGVIRLELFNSNCRVVGRTSAVTLSDQATAAYDASRAAAAEVIKIVGLPAEPAARKA